MASNIPLLEQGVTTSLDLQRAVSVSLFAYNVVVVSAIPCACKWLAAHTYYIAIIVPQIQ
jgi:hypothetical protein